VTPPIDVARERARTPGAAGAHHLNAAGAALLSERTLATVIDHLELESRIGGYEAAVATRPRLDAVYASVAALLGAHADEIALVESATVAWRRAIAALRLGAGDRVLLSRSAYVSCALHLLAFERERGIAVEVLPDAPGGGVDLDALELALATPTRMLALSHVPTTSGLVEPVAEAGALSRAAGTTFVLDATQSAGQLPVDVEAIGCDVAVATGRKYLRGPRGTGVLYVRRALLERLAPLVPDVRGAEWTRDREWTLAPTARRFETWEAAHALRLGLGVAVEEALALDVDAIAAHLVPTAHALRDALATLPGVVVADPPRSPSALVTFHVEGRAAADVAAHLGQHGVRVVSVPAAHGRWDLGARGLPAIVRASPHVYNDDADLQALVDGLLAVDLRAEDAA